MRNDCPTQDQAIKREHDESRVIHISRADTESEIVTVDSTNHFNYMADASDLGLRVGQVPERITTDLGNGQDFRLINVTSGKFYYSQDLGCITLTVIND